MYQSGDLNPCSPTPDHSIGAARLESECRHSTAAHERRTTGFEREQERQGEEQRKREAEGQNRACLKHKDREVQDSKHTTTEWFTQQGELETSRKR